MDQQERNAYTMPSTRAARIEVNSDKVKMLQRSLTHLLTLEICSQDSQHSQLAAPIHSQAQAYIHNRFKQHGLRKQRSQRNPRH